MRFTRSAFLPLRALRSWLVSGWRPVHAEAELRARERGVGGGSLAAAM